MKKIVLTFLTVFIVTFSFSSNFNCYELESNIKIANENQSISTLAIPGIGSLDPCLLAYINTYNANVDHYGDEAATAMALAAWNACHDHFE